MSTNCRTCRTPGLLAAAIVAVSLPASAAEDATALVRAAVDHWRGQSSYSEMTMTIHRPDWERSLSMRAWTEGDERSLVRVTAPVRDAGNATLLDGDRMWTYSPKVNQVIRIPSSLMSQSWMGSDFSNSDVSRADDIVDEYDHRLLERRESDGRAVNVIESVPHEDAAIVWGRELLSIRDDHVVLEHAFYDQDGVLVKSLKTLEIAEMDGRSIASRQRMQKVETPGEWTEIRVDAVRYGVDVPASLFTVSSLRNPRE